MEKYSYLVMNCDLEYERMNLFHSVKIVNCRRVWSKKPTYCMPVILAMKYFHDFHVTWHHCKNVFVKVLPCHTFHPDHVWVIGKNIFCKWSIFTKKIHCQNKPVYGTIQNTSINFKVFTTQLEPDG